MRFPAAPEKIGIHLTENCNLHCKYCYAKAGTELPLKTWLDLLKQIAAMRVFRLSLSGGEPLFYPHWREFLGAVKAHNLRFSLATNGTMLTENEAAFIADDQRCDNVTISLDGSQKLHNSARGEGTFELALRGIILCREQGLNVIPKLTIGTHNIDHLDSIAKLFFRHLKLPPVSINIAWLLSNQCELTLPTERVPELRRKLKQLLQEYPDCWQPTGAMKSFAAWDATESATCKGGVNTACGGVFAKLTILADGSVKPCTQHPEVLGNITKDSLSEIWSSSPELNSMRNKFNTPLSTQPECVDCDYREHCRGVCPLTPKFCPRYCGTVNNDALYNAKSTPIKNVEY